MVDGPECPERMGRARSAWGHAERRIVHAAKKTRRTKMIKAVKSRSGQKTSNRAYRLNARALVPLTLYVERVHDHGVDSYDRIHVDHPGPYKDGERHVDHAAPTLGEIH